MFLAPSRTIHRRLITTKEIVIDRGDVVTVDVVTDPSLFADPPLETIDGVFSGSFSCGFEYSCFEPDDGRVQAPDGSSKDIRDAWVDFVGPAEPPPFDWDKRYRVTWSGRLTGPGRYGHMGGSEYLIEVKETLESREGTGESG